MSFFFVFADGSKLGMLEAVTTGLRERQRPSVEVERMVRLRERERERERESVCFSEIQI